MFHVVVGARVVVWQRTTRVGQVSSRRNLQTEVNQTRNQQVNQYIDIIGPLILEINETRNQEVSKLIHKDIRS